MLNSGDECFYAYLAGIVDGEGCISFSRGHRNKSYYANDGALKCPKDMFYLLVQVQISNTDLPVLEYLNGKIGFGTIYRNIPKVKEHHKKQYRLSFNRQKEIMTLLSHIVPYLHIKKMQAQLMIDYCKHRIGEGRGRRHLYTKRDEFLADLIGQLNRRDTPSGIQEIQEYVEENKK
jgi:LAGLIDADG endonuclease